MKANIVRMEDLLNFKEASVVTLEAAVRDAAKVNTEIQEHPLRKQCVWWHCFCGLYIHARSGLGGGGGG